VERITRRNIPWADLEALQLELVERVTLDPRQAFLLVSEPQPTFTYGRSSNPSELLWNTPEDHGVAVHAVARGGKWTYHGPGQVVVYPIAALPTLGYPKRAARKFVSDIAEAVRRFLETLSLESEVRPEPYGVYLPQGKIASFGVSLRNGVSSHGVAFYTQPQRGNFQGIVPCGSAQTPITSLQEVGVDLAWETAANGLSDYIKRGFQASKN
jgi:lipoyl(octanoyl) transferase